MPVVTITFHMSNDCDFMDIHTEIDHKILRKSIDICRNLWDLLYADDTMLIGTRARELNLLIRAIEEESEKYNLRLTYDKCNLPCYVWKSRHKVQRWLQKCRKRRK